MWSCWWCRFEAERARLVGPRACRRRQWRCSADPPCVRERERGRGREWMGQVRSEVRRAPLRSDNRRRSRWGCGERSSDGRRAHGACSPRRLARPRVEHRGDVTGTHFKREKLCATVIFMQNDIKQSCSSCIPLPL